MTQYYVLKQEECGCKRELTKRFPRGCPDCKGSGIRTKHVPLADAMAEVDEENARLYLESVKQQSPAVGKEPARVDNGDCPQCGWPSCSCPKPPPPGCPACGHLLFITVSASTPHPTFNYSGRLYDPSRYGGFKCQKCAQHIKSLPIVPGFLNGRREK